MFGLLDFQSYSLWLNLGIFAAAAAAVWYAGSKLSNYADKISKITGLGKAFIGLVLLAAATSLPEVASTGTAGLAGNAPLAVSNLFGSLVVNMVILAIVDLMVSDGALTFFVPQPVILLEGITLTALIALALAGMSVGEFLIVWNVGMWTVLILIAYLFSLYLVHITEKRENWYSPPSESGKSEKKKAPESKKENLREEQTEESSERQEDKQKSEEKKPDEKTSKEQSSETEKSKDGKSKKDEKSKGSLTTTLLYFAGASAVILVAGVMLAQIAPVLATQTGLGTGLVGTALLALSTSLPELSTTLSAVRMKNYSMAFSNLLGSSAFGVMLLLVADLFYRQGPVLQAVERSAILPAAMGIVATCVYMVGMIDRRNRTLLRMGYDSIAVLALYAATLVGLYFLT